MHNAQSYTCLIEVVKGFSVEKIVHSWKSFIAHKANKILKKEGAFWLREYFDRFIRNQKHLENIVGYIHWNPVRAGLARKPKDWKWSSAGLWEFSDIGSKIGEASYLGYEGVHGLPDYFEREEDL